MFKFLVQKQFAINSQVYNPGEIVEMSEVDSKSLVDAGNLKLHVAAPADQKFTVEFDREGITEAVKKGFAALAPAPAQKQEDYGAFLQSIAKKTINITTAGQGGYATTIYTDPMINVDLLEQSGIASLTRRTNLTGTNNIYKKNVVNSMGTAPAVSAEIATISASQPTVTQFSFTLQKLTYRMDVTEEAIEDTGALVSEVSGQVPEEFSKYVENGIINGVGPFTGIVGDTNTSSIAKETAQTAATIVAKNIDKMFSAAKRPNESIWIVSRSAYAAIQGVEDANGNRLFQGPNGIGPAVFGTLKGLRIVISDYAQALGTVGDIVLANMRKYDVVSKGGLRMASDASVLFLTDQQCFKFCYRTAGKPTGLKYTATDGTVIADFITLDTRA